jgi:hypothetical protein
LSAVPLFAQTESTSTTVALRLAGSIDNVFELFDPMNRSQWDEDWEIEIVSPEGETHANTGVAFKRLSDPETIWTIVSLDREGYAMEFSYQRPNMYSMSVEIRCKEDKPETTIATITHTALAETDQIREVLAHQIEQKIRNMAKGEEGWETKINHYLKTGIKFEIFVPLAIERQHQIEFRAAPHELFALMNPTGGNHWTASTPKYVFGSPEKPSEAMWMVGDGWMVVAEHNPDALYMKSVLYIPDFEFMIEEARCEPASEGGCILTVTWRVAGISRDGNEAVRGFFDKHWDMRMNMIKKSYDDLLAASTN